MMFCSESRKLLSLHSRHWNLYTGIGEFQSEENKNKIKNDGK
jgi:hypothetical protein